MVRLIHTTTRGALFIALIGLAIISASFEASAEEPVTIKPLLDEARANNPEIKAFEERVMAREARARAEGVLDDPTLKVEMMDLDKDRPLNTAPGNAMLTRYTVSQMFPFPGKLSLKERIAFKEALAMKAELRAKELEVSAMVKEAYYDYALVAESMNIVREIKDLLLNMERIAEARYATGQVSQQDIIKVQVEATMLTNEIISLDAGKGVAAARLKSILGRPQEAALGEPGALPKEKIVIKTEDLINTAVRQNPAIKAAEVGAEATDLNVDLAKKNYYPDFMVGVAPIQRDGRFDSFDVMFQMNIPIWRGKYDSLSREASSNARSARSRLVSEKNVKSFEVKGAAIQVEAAERTKTLYETSLLPQVELSFESALKNYQAGKIDFLTLLDTERELKRTRLEYIRTLSEYRKRIAYLERAVGEDF